MDSPTWAAVLLAVLGSSALGAIVGGWLTTWLRGRIERDEAWRTRLLDSVAELGNRLSDLLLSAGHITHLARHDQLGRVTQDDLTELGTAWGHARTALTLVGLLFTQDSATFREANGVLFLIRDMRRCVTGEMDRLSSEAGSLGITAETRAADAAIDLFVEAERRFDRFSDSANDHIRSAHLRPTR